jgi:hypothetical protein
VQFDLIVNTPFSSAFDPLPSKKIASLENQPKVLFRSVICALIATVRQKQRPKKAQQTNLRSFGCCPQQNW